MMGAIITTVLNVCLGLNLFQCNKWFGSTANQHILLKLRMTVVVAKIADGVSHITAKLECTALEAANWMIVCAMMGAIIAIACLNLNLFQCSNWLGSTANQHILLKLRMAVASAQVTNGVSHITAECNRTALPAANGMIICTMMSAIIATVLNVSLNL
jgi:hypothetical protein